MFSPSNKIHREVGRAKELSAPRYISSLVIIRAALPSREGYHYLASLFAVYLTTPRIPNVGIATGIWVGGPGNPGSIPGMGMKYSLVQKVQTAAGAQLAFFLVVTCVPVTSL